MRRSLSHSLTLALLGDRAAHRYHLEHEHASGLLEWLEPQYDGFGRWRRAMAPDPAQISRKRAAAVPPETDTPASKRAATHEPTTIEPASPLGAAATPTCFKTPKNETGCRLDEAATTYLLKYMAKGEKDGILAKYRNRSRCLWVEERQSRGAVHMHGVVWPMPISENTDMADVD